MIVRYKGHTESGEAAVTELAPHYGHTDSGRNVTLYFSAISQEWREKRSKFNFCFCDKCRISSFQEDTGHGNIGAVQNY